jgi:tRNA U34 5-methylaminomethyl-2-thiouridine-forming methyltransferase MnmC
MTLQLMPTADGSWSCLDDVTGQLCHNRAGAYTEALSLYVRPSGLLDLVLHQSRIQVLDACYGLGYNSWALINELVALSETPHFLQVAKMGRLNFPITVSLVCIESRSEMLHFLPQVLEFPTFDTLKRKIAMSEHNAYYRTLAEWTSQKEDNSNPLHLSFEVAPFWRFEITIWIDDLRIRVPQLTESFDAIFHDPFSPQKMPELWTVELFEHYNRLLAAQYGKLLTYSAAAAVRGGLREAGFEMAKTPMLGGKNGGTIAWIGAQFAGARDIARASALDSIQPPISSIPLEAWEMDYLQSKAGIPYRDPGLMSSRTEILEQRHREQESSALPSGSIILKKRQIT